MHERGFVLTPLVEIAPQVVHPILKKNAQQLLSELIDKKGVKFWGGLE
jgi:2-amino-4-hydroxy-6-hydroxymethyldihydropteridine diphosphokinase